ncbi:hypothetical protein E3Q16_04403 [Wallemia mellicola]|uniref:Hydrophobin n=1 Tax=Wallemia mellicola TaxID=1708541 RepID=A0AB74K7Y7_9BASI|nr:hypothetical protein E3Q16_04403 [Wallemia mellicola]TIC18891.1 hypothetical protein E3Q12_04380 [Wallemia mellicola]TIC30228.1 hypothetical protein E3Q09_04335 [Wallemia mellicola]TIC57909.1 hypothetical protein E3Q03_04399 [Wallemia mellicola]
MFKTILIPALLATSALVLAGGPEICTGKGGCAEYQITKDCCAEHITTSSPGKQNPPKEKAPYLPTNSKCVPYTSNGINTGGMVDCCASRGAGSKEVKLALSADLC